MNPPAVSVLSSAADSSSLSPRWCSALLVLMAILGFVSVGCVPLDEDDLQCVEDDDCSGELVCRFAQCAPASEDTTDPDGTSADATDATDETDDVDDVDDVSTDASDTSSDPGDTSEDAGDISADVAEVSSDVEDTSVDVADATEDTSVDVSADADDDSTDAEDVSVDIRPDTEDALADSEDATLTPGRELMYFDPNATELTAFFDVTRSLDQGGTWEFGEGDLMLEHDRRTRLSSATGNLRLRITPRVPVEAPEGIEIVFQIFNDSETPDAACTATVNWRSEVGVRTFGFDYHNPGQRNVTQIRDGNTRYDGQVDPAWLQESNMDLRLRLQSIGTSYRYRVWDAEEPEPTTWTAEGDHALPTLGAFLELQLYGGTGNGTVCEVEMGAVSVRSLSEFYDEPVDPWFPR